jgi:uncharacterized protein YgfB (UPF0149 family)
MDNQIEFATLKSILLKGNADYQAAESQAIACGMLVVNMAADKLQWVQLLVGDIDPDDKPQHQAVAMLGQLFDETRQQLQDSNLAFELLLADDDTPLVKRVEMVQEWCRGFVLGMAMSGVKNDKGLPEDTQDFLSDMIEIGNAGELQLGDDNESEASLAEIIEYIRMGVLLINEELQPIKQSSSIH